MIKTVLYLVSIQDVWLAIVELHSIAKLIEYKELLHVSDHSNIIAFKYNVKKIKLIYINITFMSIINNIN